MDELSPLFQEIEFHERYRGYDPDEVDAFVDRVARAAAVMRGRIAELHERVEAAESRTGGTAAPSEAEETLTRTLVLAQRTADAAIAEAREEADRVTADAATSAQAILSAAEAEAQLTLRESQAEASATVHDAEEKASLILAEAETDRRELVAQAESVASDAAAAERERLAAEVVELHEYRAFLADDIEILERHLTEERHQLTASLSALTDLLESPEAFRASRPPATSGIEINPAVLESLAEDPPRIPTPPPAAPAVSATTDDAALAPTFAPGPVPDLDEVEADVVADEVLSVPDEPSVVPDEIVATEAQIEVDEVIEADAPTELPGEADVVAAAEPEWAPEPDREPDGLSTEPEPTIDLVAAEADAAEAVADSAGDDTPPVDDEVVYTEIDLGDPDPGGGTGDGPDGGQPAFAGMVESSLTDAPPVDVAPPRLVTAADLESQGGGRLGFESSTFDSLFDDGGPATEAVPALQDASLFAEPETADDPFLAQLRDAMESESAEEGDDEALSAFFDQEEDDGGRSWFGRRR